MGYKCMECGKFYVTPTSNYICNDSSCPGEGLTGLLIEQANESGNSSSDQGGSSQITSSPPPLNVDASIEPAGLCVLLMDASGSMSWSAFDTPPIERRRLVANAAARGIFDLRNMTQKSNAYICAIRFDHTQHLMFVKTVEQIINEYNNSTTFAEYLYDEIKSMEGGTDINSALKMAASFVEKFLNGTVPGMESKMPMYHNQFSPILNKTIDVPNVRILLYTDGEQYAKLGSIVNPLSNHEPDLLMGAFIGQTHEKGCNELRQVVGNCPIHGSEQFFVLDKPEKIATLRGLFRMASGTTGFCPNCIESSTIVPNYD
ncbi:MAG: vWA domain-containing protein [Bacteroidota bacterium]